MLVSITFYLFLVLSVGIFYLIPRQNIRVIWISLASLSFITYHDWKASIVVVILTIMSYQIGRVVEKTKSVRSLQVGIILLLLALVLSKYFGLLSDTINSLLEFMGLLPVIKIEKLFIPLGISYITFKHISYLTDIYWGITKRGTFLSFLCYSSFFPIFVAGPIERFERFNPQVSGERHTLSSSDLEFAFRRIVYGLSKKLILADWLGYFIAHNSFLQQDFMLASIIKLLCFSLQIYFDFAGYSDIAIGSSRLFGFKIMENFNNPYLRSNISLFWRNWHISLSDWIRDYLFFPLGGVSRNKFWNIVLVPIIAMGLCGIWHGAAWKFLLWGVWHGIGIAIYQIWQQYKRAHKKQVAFTKSKIWLVLSTAITFAFVTVGWLWFK